MQLYFYSIQNLTEARFAASLSPDYIGFNLSKSDDNYLSPLAISNMLPWLSGTEIIAQFRYEPPQEIITVVQALGLNNVEVPIDYPDFEKLNIFTLHSSNGLADFAKTGRISSNFNDSKDDLFFEIEGNSNNMFHLIKEKNLQKIALKGREESEPGMADLSDWADLMEELEIL